MEGCSKGLLIFFGCFVGAGLTVVGLIVFAIYKLLGV